MAKVLFIIGPVDYQDVEYVNPKAVLIKAGHQVVTCSTEPDAKGRFGGHEKVDVLLAEANADDYDAILFVGGPGCEVFFEDPIAHGLARHFEEKGKWVTAICAAPTILANAGLLKGKTVTSFPSQEERLTEKGAHYTGQSVEVDGQFVTADGPESALDFGRKIVELLDQH